MQIRHTTVLVAAQTHEEIVNLLLMLVDTKDSSLHALLKPYNELVWKQDDSPSTMVLMQHDLVDGTKRHALGMTFKSVDYIIHDYDVTSERSVDKITSWFPHYVKPTL